MRGHGDRRSKFLRNNLEIMGFGNARDALIQTTKELFENALDAVISSHTSWKDTSLEMLRVSVALNQKTGCVDVVCADTGSGIRTHQIKQLCAVAFETTKDGGGSERGSNACGKYGIGLKAATLYAQQQTPTACLKITTTPSSTEILHVQLRIDPESEQPAVVENLTQFVVGDDHQFFSGTEMRLAIPCPEDDDEVEYAADVLAMYFQSLRYTVPPFVGVQFTLDIGDTSIEVECSHGENPVDRFTRDLDVASDQIAYFQREKDGYSVNSMGVMKSPPSEVDLIEISVLRYANHVPVLNADDIQTCAIIKGVQKCRTWKKLGYRCRVNESHLICQLAASPALIESSSTDDRPHHHLVVAVDVSSSASTSDSIKYGGLRKTTLDKCYTSAIQHCCSQILEQLQSRGVLRSPRQCRDDELVDTFVPLIANAATSILNKCPRILQPHHVNQTQDEEENSEDVPMDGVYMQFDPELVTKRLQHVVQDALGVVLP
ncbi:hypothetical protein Poli38472_001740 [Pythium oligandrum]|uniref:Histidine kinase/HSP90-like ATPase domain-containing protein n=1 Tax=Pythium oligandrum TaxID=41045 RepID=A0A8K1FQM6_PYTOL|nr:hypothetical protein Poli38472_001740 [Pythium oligandrum]|eukprot:TMW69584.1 hypothetical protein Poli38472_001740 [Pythium oligandrum]